MRRIATIARQQYLGLTALILVLAGGVYAASGNPVLLGRANEAGGRTVIENTGSGPALQLKNKPGSPPLRVNSNKRVPKLNASLLGGKGPGSFAAAGSSYTKAETDAKYATAGSSYTKVESDGRYPLASNVYTRSEADAAFAAAGRPIVLAVGQDLSTSNNELVLDESVPVPAAGTLYVIANAQCEVSSTKVVGIKTRAGDITSNTNGYGPGLASLARVGCTGSVEFHVDAAQAVLVQASASVGTGASVSHFSAMALFVAD